MKRWLSLFIGLLLSLTAAVADAPHHRPVWMGGNAPVFYANFAAASTVPSGLTYTSAGGGYCWNAAGVLVGPLAANTPCFDHNPSTLASLGLRSEPQRTNLLRNSAMVGAVPAGAFPNFWVPQAYNGLAWSVSAVGTSNGVPTIDIRLSGTNTVADSHYLLFDTQANLPSVAGVWNINVQTAKVGGTNTNINSVGLTLQEYTAGNAYIGGTGVTPPMTGVLTTSSVAYTATGANQFRFFLEVDAAVGAVDLTIRIALPKLEQNAFATSPILTYGSAVTVPADQWSFTGAALAALQAPATCHVVEFTPEGVYSTLNPLIKSNTTGSFGSAFVPSSTQVALANVTQVAAVSTTPSASVLNRVAAAGAPGAYAVAVNGVLGTGTYAGAQTPGSAYSLGAITGATSSMWVSQIAIRSRCTATQAQRYSTAGVNLLASLADNDNLPLVVKTASGGW